MATFNYNKANLAAAVIPASITAAQTSITIDAGDAALFPAVPFFATIMPAGGIPNTLNSEIVQVTAKNTSTGVLTITRAQRGTTAKAQDEGAAIMNGVYIEDLAQSQAVGLAFFSAANVSVSSSYSYWNIDNAMLPTAPTDGMSIRVVFGANTSGPAAQLRLNGGTYHNVYAGVGLTATASNVSTTTPFNPKSGVIYELVYYNGAWYAMNVPANNSITSDKIDWSTIEYHHNALYRGKNLGTSVTTAQWNAIKNGTFDDMFIGDYWVINGVTWRIANFDYWLNMGDTATTAHHVVIVPDSHLYTAQMNTSDVATGGYVGSKMYTENLTSAKTTINNAFGSEHILSHRTYLTSGVASDGRPNNGAWYSSTVDLMCETMVYGCSFFRTSATGSDPWTTNRIYSVDNSQLALFRLDHSRICNRTSWWLRDVVSSATFADVGNNGNAHSYNASRSLGVRPAFAIYQA